MNTLHTKFPSKPDSPREFEFDKYEIVSQDGAATPVCSFLGRAGSLPYFISEKYILTPSVRAFLQIFQGRLLELWFKINTPERISGIGRMVDVYGLMVMLKVWYRKKFQRKLDVEVIQYHPVNKEKIQYLNVIKIGDTLGCRLCIGIVVCINDRCIVDEVRMLAQMYCGYRGKVSVRLLSEIRLGISSIAW